MKIFGARNKYIDIFSNIYINNTLICKYFIMTHYENNNSSEKVQDAQMQENFANLCKAKEITEVVDIITERAWTVLSSTHLDNIIEEYRQSILHQRYWDVQAKIRSVRKRISVLRASQEKSKPKKAIEIRAAERRRGGK